MRALIRRLVVTRQPVLRHTLRASAVFAPACAQYISAAGIGGAAPFATMVPKRKKSEMALLQQDVLPNQHMDAEPPPDFAPRRSARAAKNAAANQPEPFKADHEQNGSRDSRSKNSGQVRRRRENVEDVMHDLQDMESQLRGVVKRQKLAVKSSSVMSNPTDIEKDVFTPRSTKGGRDILAPAEHWNEYQPAAARKPPAKSKTWKASKASSVKEEVVDKEEASGMTREDPEEPAEPETEDVNDIKLERARPPPVNSDYLPLPWKGRLGYVHIHPPPRRMAIHQDLALRRY